MIKIGDKVKTCIGHIGTIVGIEAEYTHGKRWIVKINKWLSKTEKELYQNKELAFFEKELQVTK